MRYFRARRTEARTREADIETALKIKLAIILGGGYPARARRYSTAIRDAVIARDNGKCRICGKPGSDVDHIKGNSSQLDNLQFLCRDCHNEKTQAGFRKISAATHPVEWAKRESLLARVRSPEPLRVCDRSDWDTLWRKIHLAKKDGAQQSLFR